MVHPIAMQLTLQPEAPTGGTLRDRALALLAASIDPEGVPPESVALALGVSEKEARDVLWDLWCDGLVARNLGRYLASKCQG